MGFSLSNGGDDRRGDRKADDQYCTKVRTQGLKITGVALYKLRCNGRAAANKDAHSQTNDCGTWCRELFFVGTSFDEMSNMLYTAPPFVSAISIIDTIDFVCKDGFGLRRRYLGVKASEDLTWGDAWGDAATCGWLGDVRTQILL